MAVIGEAADERISRRTHSRLSAGGKAVQRLNQINFAASLERGRSAHPRQVAIAIATRSSLSSFHRILGMSPPDLSTGRICPNSNRRCKNSNRFSALRLLKTSDNSNHPIAAARSALPRPRASATRHVRMKRKYSQPPDFTVFPVGPLCRLQASRWQESPPHRSDRSTRFPLARFVRRYRIGGSLRKLVQRSRRRL